MKIENDKVVNHRGDVLAEKVYGQWESKDPEVLAFIANAVSTAAQEKPAPKKEATTVKLKIGKKVDAE